MFGVIAILALLEHEEYRAPVTPAGRLRAVLEGRDDELVLTAEQTREIEAMLESWGEQPPG
jgi:type IV secretory pathway ATPase VirB11/archaellum biosynthesis ATPase